MERLNTNVKVARNAALSRLDLTGSYGWGGVSGTSTIEDPDTGEPVTIRDGWGDAAQQVFEFLIRRARGLKLNVQALQGLFELCRIHYSPG